MLTWIILMATLCSTECKYQPRHFGVVTSVFSTLLKENQLDTLINKLPSVYKDYSTEFNIELRQGSMGEPFEKLSADGIWIPQPQELNRLAKSSTAGLNLTFGIAIAAGYLSGNFTADSPLFQAALESAKLIADRGDKQTVPSLRFVDTTTTNFEMLNASKQQVLNNIAEMLQQVVNINGTLSIENGPQKDNWGINWYLIDTIKATNPNGAFFRLCYDPTNFIFSSKDHLLTPDQIAEMHPPGRPWKIYSDLQMYHIKQSSDGKVLSPDVGPGYIDWQKEISQLLAPFFGPVYLEIPASEDVFDNIRKSLVYLYGLDWSGKLSQ